jgi:hypothetical protein
MRLAIVVLLIIAVEAAWLGRFEIVTGPITDRFGGAYRLDRWTGEICVLSPFLDSYSKCDNKFPRNEDPKGFVFPPAPEESKGFRIPIEPEESKGLTFPKEEK